MIPDYALLIMVYISTEQTSFYTLAEIWQYLCNHWAGQSLSVPPSDIKQSISNISLWNLKTPFAS